jgi:uncharacterized membrane protein YdbT with pleckstrin-like domain
MEYINDSLLPGEKIIFRAKVSWAPLIIPGLVLAVLTWVSFVLNKYAGIFFLLVVLFTILRSVLALASVEFALTNSRIIAKSGILKQHSLEMLIQKVESVAVSQSLGGRIFNFGSLTVIGTGGTRETFKPISNPMELRKRINYMAARINQQVQHLNTLQN